MKALILFLIFLWLGIQPFYANDGNTSSTTTTIKSDKKKIPLIPKYKDDSATYSLLFPTVYAYLYNEVVSVDLSEVSDSFTIHVICLSTGETVFSKTVCDNVEIDLSTCDYGDYQIDIYSDKQWWQGLFYFCN